MKWITRLWTTTFALLSAAGAVLFVYLVLLGGGRNSAPLDRIYFLEASTKGIPHAPDTARWTFWDVCSKNDKGVSQCDNRRAGVPLDPPSGWNFDTKDQVPHGFIDTNYYYYMSRFFFALYLIEVFFCSIGFLGLFAAVFSTTATRYSFGLLVLTAAFHTINTSLMTAGYVRGRDAFSAANRDARLGAIAFALMWAALVLFYATLVLMLMSGAVISKNAFKPSGWELPGSEKRERNRRLARIRKVTDESRPSQPPIYGGPA